VKDQMNRRNLIKALAAFPLAAVLPPLEQRAQGQRPLQRPGPGSFPGPGRNTDVTLNAWFHGLFAFVFMPDHILVLTPRVHSHLYLAGAWREEKPLRQGEWYRLLGAEDPANANPVLSLSANNQPTYSGAQTVSMDKSYCVLRFPFPDAILPVRRFSADVLKNLTWGKPRYPLVQVLRYSIADPKKLQLDPFPSWQAKAEEQPKGLGVSSARAVAINLHFFAQPSADTDRCGHYGPSAFQPLLALFPGIPVAIARSPWRDEPYDQGLSALGLDSSQQMTLQERQGKTLEQQRIICPDLGGGANCFGTLMVVPSSPPVPVA